MPLSALYGDHYPFSSTIEEDKIKIESNEYINYLYKDGTIVIEPISIKFDKTSCTLKDSNTQYYFTDKKMYLEFEQQPAASVSDMRFKVHHPNGNITFFNVEIKTRNCCIEDCEGLPLTVNK